MTPEQRQWQQEQEEKRQKEEERRRKEEEKAAALREMQIRFRSVGDDVMLKKFLKARKYDVEAASQMLGASLRWRRAYGCPIDPVPIAHQLALGAVFESGLDYDGHPVIYHFSSGLGPNPSADQVALAARAAVYWMEKATKKSKDGKVTVVVVRDIALRNAQQGGGGGGGGFTNLRYPRHLAKILEANFPESLKRAVVYPADSWFSTLWKVASRFVDADTRAKIALVTDRSELLKYIPYNQLLRTLGGANPYRFSLDHVAPGLQQRLYSNYFPHQPRALPPPPPPPPQSYQQQPPPPGSSNWQQQQRQPPPPPPQQYPPYGSGNRGGGGGGPPPPPPPPPPPKVPGY